MSSRRTLIAVLCSALTFSVAASAGLTNIAPGKFVVKGKANETVTDDKKEVISFKGNGPVTGKVEGDKLVFESNLGELDMGERTKHTKEDFELKKFPTAKLVIEKSAIKLPEDKQKTEGDVNGSLTLHGQTKPVKVKYVTSRTGSDFHVKSASFTFDYTHFGVKPICRFMKTVCVDKMVTIEVSGLKFREQ